jgi:hypothetical protein
MDIQKLIKEQGPALIQQLINKAGFTQQQAQGFLPMLVGKVTELIKGGGIDVKALLGGGDLSGLIGKLGLGAIAGKFGIDEAKATAGAKAVLPGVMQALQKQAGGLGGVVETVKSGAGDIMTKAKGLFGGS